jgi:hypothetical protein
MGPLPIAVKNGIANTGDSGEKIAAPSYLKQDLIFGARSACANRRTS